jgi:hypothetical protein
MDSAFVEKCRQRVDEIWQTLLNLPEDEERRLRIISDLTFSDLHLMTLFMFFVDLANDIKTATGPLADQLAQHILITGAEPQYAAESMRLAELYVQTRIGSKRGEHS